MSAFQLEPLSLKVLPDTPVTHESPFHELSMPEAMPPQQNSGPADRVHELERMLADTQGKAAAIEQAAYDKAYAAGEKAGMALGQKRAEQILERMQQMQHEAGQQFADIRHLAGETIVDMAAQLSAWLIGELTSEDHSRLLALAEKTAQGLPQPEEVQIAVSPEDYADFEKLMEDSEHAFPLIADEGVPAGKVRVFNRSRDVLVDPHAALADAVAGLKTELLQEHAGRDHTQGMTEEGADDGGA